MTKILIIDDETDICLLLDRFLSKNGYEVTTASNALDGLAELKKTAFDLVISDFRLPDMDGLEFLKKAKALRPDCRVIIITGYSDIRMAVEVIKYGALDYITKPLYPEELLSVVKESLAKEPDSAAETSESRPQEEKSKQKPQPKLVDESYVVGKSSASKRVYRSIEVVAPTPMSVIINGETGTGKEYVAREIHRLSRRADQPFVAIDCGALPKDIAGSEFFGHEKGAFTGAVKSKDGKFKHADGGTLFLDEIGNLSYEIQVKLLRVLQERKFTKIGGDKDISVDVRILVATNENLKEAVREGRFREDLFYRLNEFSINLSPLRNRTEDIESFTDRFIEMANSILDKDIKGLSDEVKEKFERYNWPGNLRELRNVIKRSVLLTKGDYIEPGTLPEEISYFSNSLRSDKDPSSLKKAAEVAEREKIVKVLAETGNNKSKAAQILNIDRKTLYNKLKTYGI